MSGWTRGRAGLLLVAVVLGGCSTTDGRTGEAPAAVYVEPGWMAEGRAQSEEYQRTVSACIVSEGYEPAGAGGAIGIKTTNAPEDAALVTEEDARVQEVLTKCSGAAPTPDYLRPATEEAYQHMVDFVSCVENEGYDMPDVPSLEAWTDAGGSAGAWNPLTDGFAIGDASLAQHTVPAAEIARLQDVCFPGSLGIIMLPQAGG